MRSIECYSISLKWDDIDLKRSRLVINGRTSTKRKKPPKPFLNEQAIKIIKSLPHPKKAVYVFDDGRGEPLWKRDRWSRWMSAAAKECEIKSANLKTFRHTFASHLVMAGVPLKTVAELCGHTSVTTTEIYSHLAPEHLGSEVNKLPY